MSKIITLFALFLTVASYATNNREKLFVEITNKSNLTRNNESVTINWKDISKKIKDATPDNIIVLDAHDKEIPSQPLFNGMQSVESLLFQCSISPNECVRYSIVKGVPSKYKRAAYGRFAPDRRDDFIWENNRIAYRIYGKSLEKNLVSPGIDILLKRTPEMVINKWLKPNAHYHEDHGEGLDMYNVGKSLGVGAMTPVHNGKLIYPTKNFSSYRVLDCGVLRISFELKYPPFSYRGREVTMIRRVTLDASSNLNVIDVTYNGDFKNIDVVNGIQLRDGNSNNVRMGVNYIAYQEPKDPVNGTTYILVINPDVAESSITDGHVVASTNIKEGESYRYLAGGYWSKYGIHSEDVWTQTISEEIQKIEQPLKIKLR